MKSENPYASIAAYYDVEHRAFTEDIELYLQFVESAGDPVLELGCGTGRILRQIARPGYSVTGVDSSPEMLAFAQNSLESMTPPASVRLIEGDFSNDRL